MASKAEVGKALAATADLYEKRLTNQTVAIMLADLEGYDPAAIISALSRCRRELRTFPTVSDIVARIDDGRPGVEAAWAMIPLSEYDSTVWTTEMREAFGQVRHLVAADSVAGRMAFREVYGKLISQAREAKVPVRWEPSLGIDPRRREQVLRDAVKLGRLTAEQVRSMAPQLEYSAPKRLTLAAPVETDSSSAASRIAEIRARVLKTLPGSEL